MKIDQILSLIRGLAMSTGMYGRLYNDIMDMPDEERQDYFNYLESLNFADNLEVVRFFEEGVLPSGFCGGEPEKIDEPEPDGNHCYEVCPYCGEEVMLDAELKVQTCPNCGKRIVTCSMCRACDSGEDYCTHCCLDFQARAENGEIHDRWE